MTQCTRACECTRARTHTHTRARARTHTQTGQLRVQSRTRHRAARPRFRSRSRPDPPTANTSIQNTIIDNTYETLHGPITSPPSARLMSIIMSPTPLPNWSRISTAPVTTCGVQRVSEQAATDTRCDKCKHQYMIHNGMSLSRARTNTHTHARAHTHTHTLSHTHTCPACAVVSAGPTTSHVSGSGSAGVTVTRIGMLRQRTESST